MNENSEKVFSAALSLPPAERAELATRLIASLDADEPDASPEDIEKAWVEEAERRDRAVDEGTEELLPGEEILEKLLRGERP